MERSNRETNNRHLPFLFLFLLFISPHLSLPARVFLCVLLGYMHYCCLPCFRLGPADAQKIGGNDRKDKTPRLDRRV